MSIARDLANLFKSEHGAETRAYQRFRSRISPHMLIEGIGQQRMPVLDLSFGGFAIANQPELVGRIDVGTTPLKLVFHILDQQLPVKVQIVRVDHQRIGVKLADQTIDTVVAWHGVLNGLRQGYGLKPQKDHEGSKMVRLKFSKECKLTALCQPSGEVQALRMKFAHEGKIWEFACEQGRIVTAQAASDQKPRILTTEINTGNLEKRVLRQTIFILSGIGDDRMYQVLQPIAQLCLAELMPQESTKLSLKLKD